jgi:hypothetical protein
MDTSFTKGGFPVINTTLLAKRIACSLFLNNTTYSERKIKEILDNALEEDRQKSSMEAHGSQNEKGRLSLEEEEVGLHREQRSTEW